MCGAEEALNKYFAHLEMKKLLHEPDLSSARSEFSLPIGRTSTPINNSSKENRPQQFAVEQTSGDVAGALTPEDFIRQFANPSVSNRKSPESLSLEDFARPENKATNTTKPGKSSRATKQYDFCKFCYKNGELSDIYMSHVTKSSDGTIVCPILRKYVCDLCGATGDKAHTRKYCSFNTQQNRRHPVFRRLTNGVLTSCHNHK
ncbi:nanos homolog 2 [Anoplophora glabripennis]|uniref:nanos homolog 2 n=1 Tax=Anoplophora glabripennis TaxID=217634 RepID=UPI000C780A73|nr:nanos homolog 2 [Anoplophora glabripennis]